MVAAKRDAITRVLTCQLVDQAQGGITMADPGDAAVLPRLALLERPLRRWQVVGGMALALLALVTLIGTVGKPDVEGLEELRTRALVLVDLEGKPRMDLRVARNDSTQLVLSDREGLPRMRLNILAQGGADIVIRDQLGMPRAALSVVPDGRPGLSLYDAAGTTRVALGLLADGQTRLVLNDQGGRLRWVTP
jgi:hypothetical protein